MVVKHTDRWSPPVVMIPADGTIPNLAKYVTDGILRDYGLSTVALRQIISTPGYHCRELEMTASKGTRNLNAVWVDSRQYAKYRSSRPGQIDPIAQWLKERKKGLIPNLRPPWARAGFFVKARHWTHHNLERLNIQTTGSLEQFDAFSTGSYALRIPTSEGPVYFKTGSQASPSEAALSMALARAWPEHVPGPLCVDEKKNWMLSRHYRSSAETMAGSEDYPEVARILAKIQAESLDSMEKWQELGCLLLDLERLFEFAGQLGQISAPLREGGGIALSASDISKLVESGKYLQETCKRLQEYRIPDMLVHPEVWSPNIIKSESGYSIINWSDTMISHPFFSILKLISSLQQQHGSRTAIPACAADEGSGIGAVQAAYLEPFTPFESRARLFEAMQLVRQLENLWLLFRWNRVLRKQEHECIAYQSAARHMQKNARSMIELAPVPEQAMN